MSWWCPTSWLLFFGVRLLSVLHGHSFFHPQHNGQWPPTLKDFLSQILFITFIFLILEEASIFPFECSVLNKGTTGTIFITSLVWCGPWLGIEPGTSRTRIQHYTTRLSSRRLCNYWFICCIKVSSSQDRVDRKPTVADLEKAKTNIKLYEEKLKNQEQTIKQLEQKTLQIEKQKTDLLNMAELFKVTNSQSKV